MSKKYFERSIKKTLDWYIHNTNRNQINDKSIIYNCMNIFCFIFARVDQNQ